MGILKYHFKFFFVYLLYFVNQKQWLKATVFKFITSTTWIIIDDLVFFRATIFWSISVVVDVFINYMSMNWTDMVYFVTELSFYTVIYDWFHDRTVRLRTATILTKSKVSFKHVFPPYLIYDMRQFIL